MSEQSAKHDGKIDDYTLSVYKDGIDISRDDVYEEGYVWLNAKQALSLLAWLEQERETLEKLAKEEEDDVTTSRP